MAPRPHTSSHAAPRPPANSSSALRQPVLSLADPAHAALRRQKARTPCSPESQCRQSMLLVDALSPARPRAVPRPEVTLSCHVQPPVQRPTEH